MSEKNGKRIKLIFRLFVAVILVFYLIKLSGGPQFILNTFYKINYIWVLLPLCFAVLSFFLCAFNLWFLLKQLHPIPFISFLKFYSHSVGVSFFIPGQLGDASIAFFLKKHGVSLVNGGSAYFLDKLISVSVVFVIAGLGISYIIPQIMKAVSPSFFLVTPLIVLFFLFTIWFVIRKLNGSYVKLQKLNSILNELHRVGNIYRNKYDALLVNILFSGVNWVLVSLSYYFAFRSFNTSIVWPEVGIIPIISSLVGYIPISFSGIGTVEYSAIYLFSFLGITSNIVICVYLLQRIIQILVAFCMFMLFGILLNEPDKV